MDLDAYRALGRRRQIALAIAFHIVAGFLLIHTLVDVDEVSTTAAGIAFAGLIAVLAVVWEQRKGRPAHGIALSTISLAGLVITFNIAQVMAGLTSAGLLYVPPVYLALMVVGVRAIRSEPDNAALVPPTLRAVLGMLTIALFLRLFFAGDSLAEDAGGFIILGAGAAALYWRASAGAWFFWPAGAIIGGWAYTSLEAAGAPELVSALGAMLGAVVPGLAWELFRRLQARGVVQRFVPMLRDEAFGSGTALALENRRQRLLLDLIALVVFTVLLVRVADPSFRYSLIVEIGTAAGYALMVSALVVSLGWRVRRLRRFRLVPMMLLAAVTALGMAVVFTFWVGLEESGYLPPLLNMVERWINRFDGTGAITILTLMAVGLTAPFVIALFVLRDITLTPGSVRTAFVTIFGGLVADFIFVTALGDAGEAHFDILTIPVADVAGLVLFAAAGITYFLHRTEPGSWVIWPVSGAAAGVIFRLIVGAEVWADRQLNQTVSVQDDRFATRLGDILLASIFGALAGAGVHLAKRIWIDRDPEARGRAVRVRSAVTILHAVAPILILLFIASGIATFAKDAQREIGAAAVSVGNVAYSGRLIGDQVQQSVQVVQKQAETTFKNATDMIENAKATAEDLKVQGMILKDEMLGAVEKSAGEALDKAKAKAGEIVEKVGEGLSDAFEPPAFISWMIPDLGIGDALKDVFGTVLSSIAPDLDFKALFTSFVTDLTQSVEANFEGPRQRAQAMLDSVTSLDDQFWADAKVSKQALESQLNSLTSVIEAEKGKIYTNLQQLLVRITNFLVYMAIFMSTLITGFILWLLWKAFNGLFVMAERVDRGWKMLMQGQEEPVTA
ncbi:MAG: hypothetical protein CMM50_16980 [Rhodospirillaceae bacterium]|nr:hypothetical protein [Rhodospirillaceae bacterium]